MSDNISDIRARLSGAPLVFGFLMDSNDYLDLAESDAKRLLDEVDRLSAEVARLRDLIDRSNLEETDGYEAQGERLVKTGRILVSKDLVAQEARITEALQAAAKHANENAAIDQRYREFLRDWADMDTHVRNVAKTVLPAPAVDGNSYGVPTIEDIADMLVAEVKRQRHMLGPS